MRTNMKVEYEKVPELIIVNSMPSKKGRFTDVMPFGADQWNIEMTFDDSFKVGVGLTKDMSKKEVALLLLDMSKRLLENG